MAYTSGIEKIDQLTEKDAKMTNGYTAVRAGTNLADLATHNDGRIMVSGRARSVWAQLNGRWLGVKADIYRTGELGRERPVAKWEIVSLDTIDVAD